MDSFLIVLQKLLSCSSQFSQSTKQGNPCPRFSLPFLWLDIFCCGQIVGRKFFKNSWNQFSKPQIAQVHFLWLVFFCGGHYVAKKIKNEPCNNTYYVKAMVATFNPLSCKMRPLGGSASQHKSFTVATREKHSTDKHSHSAYQVFHRCKSTKYQIVYLNNSSKRHCGQKMKTNKKWFLQQYVRCNATVATW